MARGLLGGLLAVVCVNLYVLYATRKLVRHNLLELEPGRTALVLGTSKNVATGRPNLFFRGRIETAAELYAAGKVTHLLLSGDHQSADYDEPLDMQQALLAKGVPASAMTLDGAGLRTLDSVVRARDVYGLKKCVVITDDFHLPRALFLAQHFGLEAVGFETESLDWGTSIKTRLREYLARVKLLLDLHVLGAQLQTSP